LDASDEELVTMKDANDWFAKNFKRVLSQAASRLFRVNSGAGAISGKEFQVLFAPQRISKENWRHCDCKNEVIWPVSAR